MTARRVAAAATRAAAARRSSPTRTGPPASLEAFAAHVGGVDARRRLVWAPRVPKADHLARHAAASDECCCLTRLSGG